MLEVGNGVLDYDRSGLDANNVLLAIENTVLALDRVILEWNKGRLGNGTFLRTCAERSQVFLSFY